MTLGARLLLLFSAFLAITLSPLAGFGCRTITPEMLAAQLDMPCQDYSAADVNGAAPQVNGVELKFLGVALLLPLALLLRERPFPILTPAVCSPRPPVPPPRF